MKVTSETKTKIINAMTAKGLNNAQLGEKIGRTRSWVSKLLSEKDEIPELSDDMTDKINDALDVVLAPTYTAAGPVSTTAIELSRLAEGDARLANLLETILVMNAPKDVAYLPAVPTKMLPKIGAELTRIVHRWEDGNDPHYSKIAVETLDFLRRFYLKK